MKTEETTTKIDERWKVRYSDPTNLNYKALLYRLRKALPAEIVRLTQFDDKVTRTYRLTVSREEVRELAWILPLHVAAVAPFVNRHNRLPLDILWDVMVRYTEAPNGKVRLAGRTFDSGNHHRMNNGRPVKSRIDIRMGGQVVYITDHYRRGTVYLDCTSCGEEIVEFHYSTPYPLELH